MVRPMGIHVGEDTHHMATKLSYLSRLRHPSWVVRDKRNGSQVKITKRMEVTLVMYQEEVQAMYEIMDWYMSQEKPSDVPDPNNTYLFANNLRAAL